jgi:acetyl esterase
VNDNQSISPLLSDDLKGVAPAVVVTAALDMLRDEGVAYANKLAQADALITHVSATGLGHAFVNLIGVHRQSKKIAIQAIHALRQSLKH